MRTVRGSKGLQKRRKKDLNGKIKREHDASTIFLTSVRSGVNSSLSHACPKGTMYQDVFIHIKFYISIQD